MEIVKNKYIIINDAGECIGKITKEHSDPEEFGNYYFDLDTNESLLFENELEFILKELKRINKEDKPLS